MSSKKLTTQEFLEIAKVIAEEIVTIIEQSEDAKKIVDKAIDMIENYSKSTKTKLDDLTLLPLCQLARGILHIPDND